MVSLKKGQKVDLTKGNSSRKFLVGLGWDVNGYDGGFPFDLDVSVFCVGADNRVTSDSDFIFYNNLKHPSGGVIHQGDNRTGAGDGDDEQIMVDLSLLPTAIEKVIFTVTIDDAEVRNQNFGQVYNAYIRVVDTETNQEVLRYDLSEDFSIETALEVGALYRVAGSSNDWRFNAIGAGYAGGLEALCTSHGLNV